MIATFHPEYLSLFFIGVEVKGGKFRLIVTK